MSTQRLWYICLFICIISGIVIEGNAIFHLGLSIWVIRIFGILDLISIPTLIYTTAKLRQKR